MKLLTHLRPLAPMFLTFLPGAALDASAASGEVSIIRDRWGVPHIYGDAPEAVAFGFGYAQAEDHHEGMFRLFAKAKGELARVDGASALPSDLLIRALLIGETVDSSQNAMSSGAKRYVDAFAAGINRYFETHPARRLPWYWKVTGRDIFIYCKYATLRNGLQVIQQESRRSGGRQADDAGSNAWVIGKSRSASGSVMLLADPHLQWKSEMQWCEAHLKCPEFDFAGATLFGLPQIVMGHNAQVAWANTNNGADMADVYLEKIDQKDPDRYLDNDKVWKAMEKRSFELSVKAPDGSIRQVTREVRYTRRGPYLPAPGGASYSFAIAGWKKGIEVFDGSLAMMRARSVNEVKTAIRRLAPDKWHFVVGDRQGNVYTLGGGQFPRRNPKYNWSRPVPGWEQDAEWGPLLAFEELPQMTNPPGGLIVQCNNSVFSSTRPSPINEKDHPHYRAIRDAEFRPDSRAARAFALLDSKPRITWDDHMRAALDVKALTAQPLLDAVLSGLHARKDSLSPDLKQIESILAKWDGMATLENRAIPVLSHVHRIALAKDVDLSSTPGRAFEIAEAAAAEMRSLYGTVDVPMSRVHVLDRGGREFAMPGVGNNTKLNPFTSLLMTGADRYNSGKWYVNSGSSWMMVASFESPMKVFTLLPLGQSEDPASPHHTDQAALFSRRELKPLAFTDADVKAASERTYALELPKEFR